MYMYMYVHTYIYICIIEREILLYVIIYHTDGLLLLRKLLTIRICFISGPKIRLHLHLHMIETCLVQYYFLVASCFGFDTSYSTYAM